MLLEAWQGFEYEYGDEASRNAVANLMPKRVKKRRRIQTQDGVRINFFSSISKFVVLKYLNICFLFLERCWMGRVF